MSEVSAYDVGRLVILLPNMHVSQAPSGIEIVKKIVVAHGIEPRSRALAGVQLLAGGDLVVGYRDGSDHLVTDDGAVMITRSTDGGHTWQEPWSACELSGWDCAGGRSMVQTPSGDLMMFVLQARRAVETPESHVYSTSSSDGGRTWGPFGAELSLFSGWTEPNPAGHIHILADGRWMMPAYGSDSVSGIASPTTSASDGRTYAIVAFSDDGGHTWTDSSAMANSPDINFHEPVVLLLRDGHFLAVIRTQDHPFTSYQCYSEDEGRTWSHPQPLPFQGQTPYLIELQSKVVLCAYRDRDPSRPGVSFSLTRDGGATWEYAGRLYEGTDWNCGYPALVQLPSNEIFCVYYTCYEHGNCEIHGLFLREASRT